MTHKKIVEFDTLATPADGDLFLVVDVSDTTDDATGSLKKVTKAALETLISNTLTPVVVTAANKGDIIVYDGTNWVDLTVGADDQVLIADSGEVTGIKWGANSGGLTPDYGHIYGRGGVTNAGSISVGTFTTFGVDSATTWASGLLNGMTRTTDKLYSTAGGTYSFSLSLSIPYINGVNCKLGLSINGSAPADQQVVWFGNDANTNTDRKNPTLHGIVTLTAGQYVRPEVTCLVTARDINSTGIELTMVQVA